MDNKKMLIRSINDKISQIDLISNKICKNNSNPTILLLMDEIKKNRSYYLILLDCLKNKKDVSKEEFNIYVDLINRIVDITEITLIKIDKVISHDLVEYDGDYKSKILNMDNIMSLIVEKSDLKRHLDSIEDCLKNVNKLLSMLRKLSIVTKISGTNIVGVRIYYDELKIQRNNLYFIRKNIKKRPDNINEYKYVLSLIASMLDLIMTNVTSVLQYNTCLIKNINSNLEIPSTFTFDIYRESISNVINDLKNSSKQKKKEY